MNLFFLFDLAEEFDNYMQQDAHEFLNFLINHISEVISGMSTRKQFMKSFHIPN